MKRLTRSEIINALLEGAPLPWTDQTGKSATVHLDEPQSRQLFRYLVASEVRDPKNLPDQFVSGLRTAFETGEAEEEDTQKSEVSSAPVQWQLQSIATKGFGGLNSGNEDEFCYSFDGESLLLEGPNGSGKSSFIGALMWALTGERPSHLNLKFVT